MSKARKNLKEQSPQSVEVGPTPKEDVQVAPKVVSDWPTFINTDKATDDDIRSRLLNEVEEIRVQFQENIRDYQILYLYDQIEHSIDSFTSDVIYTDLSKGYHKKSKNVLLILHSTGGSIEPAYQISKFCCEFSKDNFVVSVPRLAKSAATLICLGAQQVHMGSLSELGPIDPQINGRSVLGYTPSLERIAEICQKYPKSSELFADFLHKNVYLPNIGYYERLGESAVQYAEKLIANKSLLKGTANAIAKKLVYEYKDHGFVIDANEAQEILGSEVIKVDSPELRFAEAIHNKINFVNILMWIFNNKTIRILGNSILINEKKEKK